MQGWKTGITRHFSPALAPYTWDAVEIVQGTRWAQAMKAPCVRLIQTCFPEPLCVFRRKLLSRESCMKQYLHSPCSHLPTACWSQRPTPLGSHSSPRGWVSISPFPHILLAFLWVYTPLLNCSCGDEADRCSEALPSSTPAPLSTPLHILQLWISLSAGTLAYRWGRLTRGWCPPPVSDRGNWPTGPSASSPRLGGVNTRTALDRLLEVPSGNRASVYTAPCLVHALGILSPLSSAHLNPQWVGSVRKREHQRKRVSFRTSSSPNPRADLGEDFIRAEGLGYPVFGSIMISAGLHVIWDPQQHKPWHSYPFPEVPGTGSVQVGSQ